MSKPLVWVELMETGCQRQEVERKYAGARRVGQPHFRLNLDFSEADLRRIVEEHAGARYFTELLHVIAVHPHATGSLLETIWEFSEDAGVLNAVVTSPKVTPKILRKLRKSGVKSVAQHAEFGLLRLKLATARAAEIKDMLKNFLGDEGIALGVRGMIASHKRTPVAVLRMLKNDPADFVCKLASENLEGRPKRSARRLLKK